MLSRGAEPRRLPEAGRKLSTLDYLNLVTTHLPGCLASTSCVAEISRIAAILPPSSNFGFECRLGHLAADADFLVAVIPSDGSRGAWAGENSLSVEPVRQETWRKLQLLVADWHHHRAGTAPIHDAWLEFDVEPGAAADRPESPGPPVPSFFFGFDSSLPVNYPELTLALVERLLGHPLPPARREKLEQAFSRLPAGGVIFQVGVMLGRLAPELRLCLRRISRRGIVGYLEDLGWPGRPAELQRLVEELEPLVDGINLDISVGETVGPAIGLECTIRDGPAGRTKMAALFGYLGERGACLPAKAEAVSSWLGYSTELTHREIWPGHLLKASEALGPRGPVSTFARTLNHFKISCQEGQPMGAKVYLGARHFWATGAGGRA